LVLHRVEHRLVVGIPGGSGHVGSAVRRHDRIESRRWAVVAETCVATKVLGMGM